MTFWLDFLISIPRTIFRIVAEFSKRGMYWMIPLVVFLVLIAVLLLAVGSVQPLAPFIYSLI